MLLELIIFFSSVHAAEILSFLNIEEPATNTSTPELSDGPAVLLSIPPSISIKNFAPICSLNKAASFTFLMN